ncbi:MAG: MFS transporter [Hydrogenophilaceae bacterium]|jgi:MFS family permease|nr:MFS transporter [Hydrogenophilaceae bacterium]
MADAADTSAGALFRQRDYMLYWCSRAAASLGVQIQAVALAWQMYDVARRTMDVPAATLQVGLIGAATFLPLFFLALPAGEMADRRDRKAILIFCYLGEAATGAALLASVMLDIASAPLLLAIAVAFGTSRAFFSPANTAMGPMLVPRSLLPRAIAWSSLAWQTAAVAGPAVAGLLIALSLEYAYGTAIGLYLFALAVLPFIRTPTKPATTLAGSRWTLIRQGLVYVWRQKIVFGAISLDLFAVLLGAATALLPAFARDVLHVGSEGYGWLRAAPGIGAAVIALYLARDPISRHAGPIMFWGVAVFALATIAFGLSQNYWLSLAMLAILGGADMLSVYIRQTLVQLVTPDVMRGRVAAVSTLFISASNELGEFRGGVAAWLIGPKAAVVFGGVAALVVTGLWAKMFPDLRKADRLD